MKTEAQKSFGDQFTFFGWIYFQYLLITGLYMLEPWERTIFNVLLLAMLALFAYTAILYVPGYLAAFVRLIGF